MLLRMSHDLKLNQLFISGIFHLLFLDCGWEQVTETLESEIVKKGALLYLPLTEPF